ncbi:NUDIX hydrolase [Streptomyces noursei]|uniref:NUDIX hydrolase n=1 Tax=Streptomyces noursei TaxID=1971 RepID=UPI0035D71B57
MTAREQPSALLWETDTGEPHYAPHIEQWGTASWLGQIRDRARCISMERVSVVQSLVTEQPRKGTGATNHIRMAMATLRAPSREALIHASLAAGLIQAPHAIRTPVLGRDSQAALLCMAAGLSTTDTARALRVSVQTLSQARDALRREMGAMSDVHAVALGWAGRLLHAGSALPPVPALRSAAFELALGPEPPRPAAARMGTSHALISRADGAVLMVRAADTSGRPLYRLPATKLRRGERPERAAERILLEETGLRAVAGRQVLQEWIPAEPGRDDLMVLVYDCGTVGTSGMPLVADEGEDGDGEPTLRWVRVSDLSIYCHQYQGRRVAAAVAARLDGTHVVMHRDDAPW